MSRSLCCDCRAFSTSSSFHLSFSRHASFISPRCRHYFIDHVLIRWHKVWNSEYSVHLRWLVPAHIISVISGTSSTSAALHVMKIADQWKKRDENEAIKFRITRIAECAQYPKLALFPEPVQLLIVDQLKNAMKTTDEEEPLKSELDDDLICQCLFYRFYQLSCRHIWQYHLFHDVITDRDWRRWVNMFEDSSFEIYESITKTYVIKKIHDVIDDLNKHTLKKREIITARSIRQDQ